MAAVAAGHVAMAALPVWRGPAPPPAVERPAYSTPPARFAVVCRPAPAGWAVPEGYPLCNTVDRGVRGGSR